MVYGSAYVELMGVWHNYGTIAPMTRKNFRGKMISSIGGADNGLTFVIHERS